LIKFAPQPVMAGFQNAAAALLFLVQIGNVCGFDRNVPFTQVTEHLAAIKPLSVVIAAITVATMWNARKLLPKVPPIIVAIALGCALYFFCKLVGLGAYLGPVITSASRPTMGFTAFDYFHGIARGGDFLAFMPTILGAALALAIIASIDALLCAKLVIAPGEPRRDGDRLLLRLGVGNVAAACIGGITGGINIGASITNRTFGGRRSLSVLISAAVMLVAGAFLFRWLGQMPRAVLSAVIMVVAVQHFDLWSLRLAGELRKGPISARYHVVLDLGPLNLSGSALYFIGLAASSGLRNILNQEGSSQFLLILTRRNSLRQSSARLGPRRQVEARRARFSLVAPTSL
jgi:SulP family sulfate permease